MKDEWQAKLPPFNRHMGIEITDWKDGEVHLAATVRPEYCNNSGIAHGGFLSALLDMATGHAGIYCPVPGNVRKALTLSLNIAYVGQAASDDLRVVGRVVGGGRKVFYSAAEIFDADNNLVATAQAVCRYRTGSEGSEGVPLNPNP